MTERSTERSTEGSIDIAGLSAEEKRALLSRLLMEQAAAAASAHPLSYGKQSLWFQYQLAPGNPAYTISYAGRISGDLDVTALERAAERLSNGTQSCAPRLPCTRASLFTHPSTVAVRIHRHDVDPDELDDWIRREANRPFDLQAGPVFRLTLLRNHPTSSPGPGGAPYRRRLLVDRHHSRRAPRTLCRRTRCRAASICPERYVDYADRQADAVGC